MRNRLRRAGTQKRLTAMLLGLLLVVATVAGCGRRDSGGKATTDRSSSETTAVEGGTETDESESTAYRDEQGRKWVAPGIPYDVWFQDPLEVASYEAPSGGSPEQPSPGIENNGTEPSSNSKPSEAAEGKMSWAEVVPGQVVDDEVKKINNRLRAKLRNVTTYNSSYLELPPHVTTMAVLAAVAVEHPQEIRWKEDAAYVRDLAASMLKEKLARGPKWYKQVNEPWLQINDILSGSPPSGLPEPAEGNDFSEAAEMGLLMKRLEIGMKWLNINVGSAAALTENANDVKHEALVMAAIGKAITHESYFLTDEVFDGYAAELIDGCQKIVESADTGNFDDYQLWWSKVDQACTKCHDDYR